MTKCQFEMSVAELCDGLLELAATSNSQLMVTDLSADSRSVGKGALFIAYPGVDSDGRDYMLAAQQSGAAAILYEELTDKGCYKISSELTIPVFAVNGLQAAAGHLANRFFAEPSSQMQIFGVTGTNGKTTSCYLLTQALTALGLQSAMIGTIGLGQLDQLQKSINTTPGAIDVHRLLAQWLSEGITHVCMEVSSHALDQGRVNGVQFFCTLFSNLSHDHLDYHQTMAQYQQAKERLFTEFQSELVITNADEAMGAGLIDIANSEFIASFSEKSDHADVYLDEVSLTEKGITLTIDGQGVDFEVSSKLVGKVNIPNVLMLVTALLSLSVPVEEIQTIVAQLEPAPGRMEMFKSPDAAYVVVDYAHTPDALEKALLSVEAHCSGKLWCVFGCGGDRDQQKRSLMGSVASKIADHIVLTNDNPRSELPEFIIDQITQGIDSEQCSSVNIIHDRVHAIQYAIEHAAVNDWVLLAGKGHEDTQKIGDQLIEFSDRDQVRQCLGVYA